MAPSLCTLLCCAPAPDAFLQKCSKKHSLTSPPRSGRIAYFPIAVSNRSVIVTDCRAWANLLNLSCNRLDAIPDRSHAITNARNHSEKCARASPFYFISSTFLTGSSLFPDILDVSILGFCQVFSFGLPWPAMADTGSTTAVAFQGSLADHLPGFHLRIV
jgi:hypothetical protein